MNIPGDDFSKKKYWSMDQSVLLKSTTADIWPWLVQMGTGRAGWYSYDILDNLGRPSLKHIDSALQNISKGQKIPFAQIADFQQEHYLTYNFGDSANMTYFLQKKDDSALLTSRVRVVGPAWLLNLFLRPGHWLMQTKQFKEIKKRTEAV